MKNFFKLTSKFFVVSICTIALCISVLAYNSRSAIDYAGGHYNDGKGLCAEFVSDCLIAGDMRFSAETDKAGGRLIRDSRGNLIYPGCWGLFNDLSAREEIQIITPTMDRLGRLPWCENEGKVKPGDVLFIQDLHPADRTDTYVHVVLVGDRVGEFVTMYGHNNNRNNEVLRVDDLGSEIWICAHFKK